MNAPRRSATQWASLALCALAVLASLLLFSRLPAQIPVHWNAAGVVDRYDDRAVGAFVLPGVMLAVWALFVALPRIAPSGWRIEPFAPAWARLQLALLVLLLFVHGMVLGAATGRVTARPEWVIAGVGLLLVVIGNVLGKTTRNFFMGIRTPWTLASDEVWRRTHRLGGWLMVAGGIVLVLMGALGSSPAVLIGVLLVVSIVPVVYSFLEYRRIEGFRPPSDD